MRAYPSHKSRLLLECSKQISLRVCIQYILQQGQKDLQMRPCYRCEPGSKGEKYVRSLTEGKGRSKRCSASRKKNIQKGSKLMTISLQQASASQREKILVILLQWLRFWSYEWTHGKKSLCKVASRLMAS